MFGSTFPKGKFVTHFSFCHSFLAFHRMELFGRYMGIEMGIDKGILWIASLWAKLVALQGLATVQQRLSILNTIPILIIIISRNIPNSTPILSKNFHTTFRPHF